MSDPSLPWASIRTLRLIVVALLTSVAVAQVPSGYYATVDTSSAAALRATLHAIIDDNVKIPYTATGQIDTWDVLESAQEDPANPSNIIDIYRNRSFPKQGGGNSLYNREHTWAKSYGFPDDGPDNYPYTDCHHLFLSDDGYNTARSNKPFDNCTASASEYPTDGGTNGQFPGLSNWTSGSYTNGRWQVWADRRGDVARAMFYMDVRYEGGVHGVGGAPEPDLILTDDRSLMDSSNTGSNRSVGYMGLLSVLLQWNQADPPDAREMRKNDVVFAYQGNRNPFIDHPEWVALIYGGPVAGSFATYGVGCGVAPAAPPAITASGQPLIGQSFVLALLGAPHDGPTVLQLDVQQQAIDLTPYGFTGCTALTLPTFALPSMTSPLGTASMSLPIPPDQALVTQSVFAQWIVFDPIHASIAASNGGQMTFGRL